MGIKEWPDEMFDSLVECIKGLDPLDQPLEWKLVWDNINFYKLYREKKAANEIQRRGER